MIAKQDLQLHVFDSRKHGILHISLFVMLSQLVIVHEPPKEVKTKKSKKHIIRTHNFWIDRLGPNSCPYCRQGSVPVHESELKAEMEAEKNG